MGSYPHDIAVIKTGIAFTIISFIGTIWAVFWLGPLRKCLSRFSLFKSFAEPPIYDKRLTQMKESISDRYAGLKKRFTTRNNEGKEGHEKKAVDPNQPAPDFFSND
jgi:hypothetical protein